MLSDVRNILNKCEALDIEKSLLNKLKTNLARLNMYNKYNSIQLNRIITTTEDNLSILNEMSKIEPDESDSFYNPLLYN